MIVLVMVLNPSIEPGFTCKNHNVCSYYFLEYFTQQSINLSEKVEFAKWVCMYEAIQL